MSKTVIPEVVNQYFANGTRKIISVRANNDYTLTLVFDNNECRFYDMSAELKGVFSVLKKLDKFKEVFIDDSGNIAWDIDKNINSKVVWNNRIDICKDSAYISSVPIKQGAEH